jgi:hypothetical protein
MTSDVINTNNMGLDRRFIKNSHKFNNNSYKLLLKMRKTVKVSNKGVFQNWKNVYISW